MVKNYDNEDSDIYYKEDDDLYYKEDEQNQEPSEIAAETKEVTVVDSLENITDNLESIGTTLEQQRALLTTQNDLVQEQLHVQSGKSKKSVVVDKEQLRDIEVRIVERPLTFNGGNMQMAQVLYYAQQQGMKLRHVEATLGGGVLTFDGDKYRSSNGQVKFGKVSLGLKDTITGMIRKSNDESFFWPNVNGHGTVQLKDTVKHLHMLRAMKPTKYIFENGIYLASTGNFKFGITSNLKIKSIALSKKTMFQTHIEGQGVIIIELPIHPDELEYVTIEPGRPLRVNGKHVLYRTGNVQRNEVLATSVLGSVATGAGFVEEYTGEGTVVLAPSANLFDTIIDDYGVDAFSDSIPSSLWGSIKDKVKGKNTRSGRGKPDNYDQ